MASTSGAPGRGSVAAAVVWLAAGAVAILTTWSIGASYLEGFTLDMGSLQYPAAWYAGFLVAFALLGSFAAVAIGLGLAQLVGSGSATAVVSRLLDTERDRRWLVYGAVAAFLVPALLRLFLLDGFPLTDDEDVYRLQAELLASGRLWSDSPPLKLFFDAPFVINDGCYYTFYFLGWPALMAPFVGLGLSGYVNALLSAATFVPLFGVAREVCGSRWAKVVALLYLTSPMLMVAAATEMSHTSCMAALAWATWFAWRVGSGVGGAGSAAGLAVMFSAAFFNRPLSALGIGVPLLMWWVLMLRGAGRSPWPQVAAFVLPSLLFAGLFLGVNQLQNGHPLVVGYARGAEYAAENGFRFFTGFKDTEMAGGVLGSLAPRALLAHGGTGLLRLNFALLGWPCSLLFLALAGASRRLWVLWASFGLFVVLNTTSESQGIDTFGPTHFFEVALPILLLTGAGMQRAHRWLSGVAETRSTRVFVPSLVAGLVVVALALYAPVRLGSIARMVDSIRVPYELVWQADLHDAIVFTSRPFASRCGIEPTRHFKLFHPLNDPDFGDDVLWANHLTVEEDRQLMPHFPGRTGYVQYWADCQLHMVPLDMADPAAVPRGRIGGSDVGLESAVSAAPGAATPE